MTLGQKIKEARLERKMTQADVVGDYITRNMLSKIENGSATPSVKTLEYIAAALNLPAGYFISDAENEPAGIVAAREAYTEGRYLDALDIISEMDLPRSQNEEEAGLLQVKCCTKYALELYNSGNIEDARAYAREAIKHNAGSFYYDLESELECYRLLMLWAVRSDRNEYSAYEEKYLGLLRDSGFGESYAAIAALRRASEEGARAAAESLPAEEPVGGWARACMKLIRARALMEEKKYAEAAEVLSGAEKDVDGSADKLLLSDIYTALELCYKELEDYKQAYICATKRLGLGI